MRRRRLRYEHARAAPRGPRIIKKKKGPLLRAAPLLLLRRARARARVATRSRAFAVRLPRFWDRVCVRGDGLWRRRGATLSAARAAFSVVLPSCGAALRQRHARSPAQISRPHPHPHSHRARARPVSCVLMIWRIDTTPASAPRAASWTHTLVVGAPRAGGRAEERHRRMPCDLPVGARLCSPFGRSALVDALENTRSL